MRKPVPRFLPFDNRDPDKTALYPMPLPDGIRCVAVVSRKAGAEHNDVAVWAVGDSSTTHCITGFAPHIETAVDELYGVMMSEPLPGVTVNGQQKYFPGVVFDLILHDRHGEGSGTRTRAALEDWELDDEWPVSSDIVCALALATLPLTAFNNGLDDCDLWMRRSHLMRGCTRIGMANPHANPHPTIRPATLAPESWSSPAYGRAGTNGVTFWTQVDNCFKKGYAGCLVVDVMQPWSVRGNHYQIITEEDFI